MFGALFAPLSILFCLGVAGLPEALAPVCRLRNRTGLPCPACGALRALRRLLAGDVTGAWLLQPLAMAALAAAALYTVYAWAVLLGRRPRLRVTGVSRRDWALWTAAAVCLALANWAYLYARGR